MIIACLAAAGVLALAQAVVTNVVQLGALRVLLGLSLGGLLPSITAAVKHLAPPEAVGRVLGLGVSAQYVGQVDQVVANAFVALDAAGAGPGDVVRSVVYVRSDDRADLAATWQRLLDSPLAPAFTSASTLLGVAQLGFPAQLVEVDLTAALAAEGHG